MGQHHESLLPQTLLIAGNGPLLCAIAVLGNSLLFHDFDNASSVLIHLRLGMERSHAIHMSSP